MTVEATGAKTATAANEAVRAPGPYRLLSIAATGTLLAPLNSTMLAVALPEIRADFGISHAAVGWLISSYLIVMAVTQPIGGRLGDELGRMRVFRTSLVAFLAFSLAAATAPNFAFLVAFRALQAVAGAILIPNGMGMLRAGVPIDQFGKFSGLNSAVIGSAAAVGPLLGGAILFLGPWRMLFLLNIPICALAMLAAGRIQDRGHASEGTTRVDWIGVTLFALLLGLTTLFLNEVFDRGGIVSVLAAAATACAAVLFILRQMHTPAPSAAWSLFRHAGFVGASSHILLMNLAMYTTLLAVPFFIVDFQGRSATVAGVLLGAMAALQAAVAPFAGRVSDVVGRRAPAMTGSIAAVTGALMLALGIHEGVSIAYLAVAVAIMGFGVGVGFVSATAAAIETAPRALAGSAAGTQSMMRYSGSIVGAGALAGLLSTTGDEVPGIGTFRLVFVLVAALVACSLVSAWLIRPFARDREPGSTR